MAIRIEAQLAKKIPITGADYSSQQASITISAEVADPTQVVAEAERLYRLCTQAVDSQLGLRPPVPARTSPQPSAHRPAPARRGPPPVTASQLKLLGFLLQDQEGRVPAILHHYGVTSLEHLSVKQASEVIDGLKATA